MASISKWAPFAAGWFIFALCALLAQPSIYWLDSGELTAAAAGLGVPHPTGFPLYAITGYLASLIPFGEIGYRVTLVSAIGGGVTAYFVAKLLLALDDGIGGGLAVAASSLFFAVSALFIRSATIAEVYAPTTALLAASLYLFFCTFRQPGARTGLLLAVSMGLGLGLHGSYRLLVFLPALVMLVIKLRRRAKWPIVVPGLTASVAMALHIYFPIRAQRAVPALDWGHTSNVGGFLDHLRAASIRESFAEQMLSFETVRWRVAVDTFVETIFMAVGPVAIVVAVVGLIWLLRRKSNTRWLVATVAMWLVIDFAYSVWVNPMGLVDRQNGTPTVVVIAVLVGVGVLAVSQWGGRFGPMVAMAVISLVVLPISLTSLPTIWSSRSGDLPLSWAEAALDQAPPSSTLFVVGDSTAAPLRYAQTAMGARPDAVVAVRQFLADRRMTRELWNHAHPDESVPNTMAAMMARHPALWEAGGERAPGGYQLVPAAPLFLVQPQEERMDPRRAVDRAVRDLRELFAAEDAREPQARRVQSQILTQLSVYVISAVGMEDRLTRAAGLLDAAVTLDPDHARAWVNRGVVASMRGDWKRAISSTRRAVEVDGAHARARINLARYLLATGDAQGAWEHAARATVLSPQSASAFALASQSALRLGMKERAGQLASEARRLNADNRDVRSLPKP